MNKTSIHLFHIFIVGALFIATGLRYVTLPTMIYTILGVIIFVYHTWRAFNNNWSPINVFHMLIVAPLLIAFAHMKRNWMYDAFLALGAATIGYHAVRSFQNM